MVYQLAVPVVQKVKVPALPRGWGGGGGGGGGVVTNDWCIIMVGFKFLPTFVPLEYQILLWAIRVCCDVVSSCWKQF